MTQLRRGTIIMQIGLEPTGPMLRPCLDDEHMLLNLLVPSALLSGLKALQDFKALQDYRQERLFSRYGHQADVMVVDECQARPAHGVGPSVLKARIKARLDEHEAAWRPALWWERPRHGALALVDDLIHEDEMEDGKGAWAP